jgi:quercetin dioxygenase-like cupin family protein
MEPVFFEAIDWNNIPATEHSGHTGVARWKIIQNQRFRMRVVEYSKGYTANHWCARGHIVFCLEGEMISELSDGRVLRLSEGMSYQVSDGLSSHRSHSKNGVKLLIIDGSFLKGDKSTHRNPWRM